MTSPQAQQIFAYLTLSSAFGYLMKLPLAISVHPETRIILDAMVALTDEMDGDTLVTAFILRREFEALGRAS